MRARTLLGATGGAPDAPPAVGPIQRVRRIALAAAVAVVLAVAAGCGGDDGDREQRPADVAGGRSGVAVAAERADEAPERRTRAERRARRSHEGAVQVSSGTSAPQDGDRTRPADADAPPLPSAGSDRAQTRTLSGGTSKPPQARLQASSPPAETPAGTSGAPPSPGG